MLDLDTYPLRNLICPWSAERAKTGRGKPVLIMYIGFLACFHAISLVLAKSSRYFSCPCRTEAAGIAHKRLVACSARIVADKQTDRQTDRQTHRTTTVTLDVHARRGLITS